MLLNPDVAGKFDRAGASLPALGGQDWVRLVFPGIDDPQAGFERPIGGLLSGAIEEVLEFSPLLGVLEVVSFPGRCQQEYLITGHLAPEVTDQPMLLGNRGPNQGLVSRLHEAGVSWEAAFIASVFQEAVVPRIGIEVVDFGVEQIGCAPVVTSRLASTTSDRLTLPLEGQESPFTKLVTRLGRTNPHLSRTVIAARSRRECAVEQQVGYFGHGGSLLYRDDRAAVYADWEQPAHAERFGVSELTSNVAAVTDADWGGPQFPDISPARHNTVPGFPSGKSGAWLSAAQAVVEDGYEFARLLGRGQPAGVLRAAYDELGLTPTIRLDVESLTGLLGLVPTGEYGDWGPFASPFPSVGPPAVSKQEIVREASGTDHSDLDSGGAAGHAEGVTAATVGAEVPAVVEPVARTAVQGLRAHGATVHSKPKSQSLGVFERRYPEAETELAFIGTRETLHAGDLLYALLTRDAESGVTVAVDDEATARWVLGIARTPFRENGDAWTALYGQSVCYWLLDGGRGLAVVPRDRALEWQTRGDGRLRLCVDGTPVATGELSAPPDDGDAPVACLLPEAGNYNVYNYQRDPLGGYSSIGALAETYQPVPLPVHPDKLTYLSKVSVFETTDGVLSRVTPELPTGSDMEQGMYPASFQPFAEQYFRETPGATIDFEEVARRLRQYLYGHAARKIYADNGMRDAFELSDNLPAVSGVGNSETPTHLEDMAWLFSLADSNAGIPGRSPVDHELNQIARQFAPAFSP